jgi:hypothetical protein
VQLVRQRNCCRIVGRSHKIAQNICRLHAVRQYDGRKLCAHLLRNAELYTPAEQEPGDNPVPAGNA